MSEAAVNVQLIPNEQLERIGTLGAITTIDTAEGEMTAVDGLAFVQTIQRNLEKARKDLVGPLNLRVKQINDGFKDLVKPIDAAEETLKKAILDWRRRERERIEAERLRVQRENEQRERLAREEEERQRTAVATKTASDARAAGFTEDEAVELAQMESADVAAPVVLREVAPAPVANTTKATLGSAVGRMVWKFEVQNPMEVPRAYLAVDEAAIRRAMNDGVRDIPGVRFYQEESIAGRSAS